MPDFFTFINNKIKSKKQKENFIEIQIDDLYYKEEKNVKEDKSEERFAIIEII